MLAAIAMTAISGAQNGPTDQDAGSLFNKGTRNPYTSRTARMVGDVLTVVVSETTNATYNVSTTATKKDDNNIIQSVIPFISALKIPLLDQLLGAQSTGATSNTNGTGGTTATGKYTGRMAVTVKDVLPNGNLVIEGTRLIKINKEDQLITFTGVVRVDDVKSDNTVLSENVAEAKITNLGKGTAADRQRKGIITRLLDWLF